MISSLKNNKRERTSVFEKTKNIGSIKGQLHFDKKASKKQLEKIRIKLKQENQKAIIKKALFFIIFLSVLIYFSAFYKY